MSSDGLPEVNSPDVHLVVANLEELQQQWHHNSAEWRGPFDLETYLRREQLLIDQELTKNGGLTPWLLVHQPQADGPRKILCGCETINKRAFVARNGNVEEVLSNGVASVFCPTEHRGKGYAGRMMSDLAKKLATLDVPDKLLFSVLYSDIGKKFYAARGWQNFDSAHVSLKPSSSAKSAASPLPEVKLLQAKDIADLCAIDEALLKKRLASSKSKKTLVAVAPDARTIAWIQARAKFFADELHHRSVVNVGAIVDITPGGRRAWCYWQQNWSKVEADKDNKLYILRVVVEDEAGADFAAANEDGVAHAQQQNAAAVKAVAALLSAAQIEAASWQLSSVEMWNPTSVGLAAARMLEPSISVEHRESSSIAALQWYGAEDWHEVDWVCNERYGWN